MKLREIAGSGSAQMDILKDSLFIWDAEHHAPFPTKVTFRYTLPSHYKDGTSGERHRLPPTYQARLSGIPGFRVEVSYSLVVYISRIRDKLDWWRRDSRYIVHYTLSALRLNHCSVYEFRSGTMNEHDHRYLDRFRPALRRHLIPRRRCSAG